MTETFAEKASKSTEITVADALFRDSQHAEVLIADGFGISVSVSRGHLVIADGLGRSRRERRIPRAQRIVRRIVVLGHTGNVTLDAVRWCHDTGVGLTAIDITGRVLLTAGAAGRDDARLRRSQAAATNSSVGIDIAKALLAAKIGGQASVAATRLKNDQAAETLRRLATELADTRGLVDARAVEATASNVYFGAWTGTVAMQFARSDTERVPQHWGYFAVRRSPINRSSPRGAADPINAMLNYSYALAESECRLALTALGLDPGLGIVHTDTKNRDSLALDLLEPLRPIAEDHVLGLTAGRHFASNNFHETRAGVCRLLPPLTHELADAITTYATTAARLAEDLSHALARSVPGKISLTTPLSRINTANSQNRGERSAKRTAGSEPKIRRTCHQCGTELYGSARKLCPTCWPVARKEYMRQLGLARAQPKSATPTIEELSGGVTLEEYQTVLLPALAAVPLREIERVTGLVNGSCSRVKRGLQIPNPKLWPVLAQLAATSTVHEESIASRVPNH